MIALSYWMKPQLRPRARPLAEIAVLVLAFSASNVVQSRTVEVSKEKIQSAQDIQDALGNPAPAGDAPAGFSWGSYGGGINITTSVLFPMELQEVPPVFEVMPEISATPLGAFQERYKDWGYHCVEIDFQPPACWPVLGDSQPLPRFGGVAPGEHTLRVAVTDPTGSWIVASSWSAVRRIVVVDPSEATQVATTDASDPDKPSEDPSGAGGDVRLSVPVVRVVNPQEMSVLTSHFFDMTYEVMTENPAQFEEHFKNAFVCASLDGGCHACWPLFDIARSPRWVGVVEGFHTVAAVTTHPNTGQEILDSWSRVRAFLVYTGDGSGGGDGAKGGAGGGGGLFRIGMAAGTRGGSNGGGGGGRDSSGAGGNNSNPGSNPGSDSGRGGNGGGGDSVGGNEDQDHLPCFVVLDIDMNGHKGQGQLVTHKLPVQRSGADFELVAARFCKARGVGNAECTLAIVQRIKSEFQKVDAAHAAEKEARRAADAQEAEEASRRFAVPEGGDGGEAGWLLLPRLGNGCRDVEAAMRTSVETCAKEHALGEVGLECLTAQSSLFGMREHGGCMRGDPAKQEALLEFIGNLGAGFGF